MPDPITPVPWDGLSLATQFAVHKTLDEALVTLTRELFGTPDSILELEGYPPAVRRDFWLARIAAAAILEEHLREESKSEALMAGTVEGAPATYSGLGAAAGLTREGARTRWPGAVPDARPGRPGPNPYGPG